MEMEIEEGTLLEYIETAKLRNIHCSRVDKIEVCHQYGPHCKVPFAKVVDGDHVDYYNMTELTRFGVKYEDNE